MADFMFNPATRITERVVNYMQEQGNPRYRLLTKVLNDLDLTRLPERQAKYRKIILDNLVNMHPFIIEPGTLDKIVDVNYEDCSLPDLPFRTCSFEMAGQELRPLVQMPILKGQELSEYLQNGKHVVPGSIAPVLICHELIPGDYLFAAIELWEDHLSCSLWRENQNEESGAPGVFSMYPMLRELLKMALSHKIGSLPFRPYLQVGRGSYKKTIRPQPIVYISKEKVVGQTLFSRFVDWSHRWEVMGHWRTCAGTGKDRDGVYSIQGKTWVIPHVKGKGELVRKTRIVNEGQGAIH